MANIKFTQLPDQGLPTDVTIMPTVASGTNYTVTGANLKAYVNSTTGNVTAGNVLTGGLISAAGNVSGAYIIGDGSQLTNITSTYGNANVAVYLPVNSSNIQGNFISAIGNISGNYVLGNGSQLTGLPATYGNANVSNYLASGTNGANIVTQANVAGAYVIADGSALTNLTGAAISGTISVAGNITGAYIKGNISAATGGYGNSNVQAVLQTYSGTLTAGSLSTTGNITAPYFIGNGSALTGITASLGGTMVANINGAGYSISNVAGITATGNITGANISGNLTGSGANLTGIPTSIVAGTGISVSAATGTVTITNNNPTPYTNANVAAYLPTYTGNLAGGNLAVTSAVTAASVSASGTITGTHLGNGAGLSNIVTSIVAGSGISINQSTGAVTITNTGAAVGNATGLVNGTANILYNTGTSVWGISPNGVSNVAIFSSTSINLNKGVNMSGGSGAQDTLSVSGNASFGNGPVTFVGGTSTAKVDMSALQNAGGLIIPTATAVATRALTGVAGSIRVVTDSPTVNGRVCYWASNSIWRYISDNAAV